MLLTETDEIREIPCVNGRKMALIEEDEYAFVDRNLDRWSDCRFKPLERSFSVIDA